MGTIITTRKNLADQYNHFRVYAGSGNLGCAGWGVRQRDTAGGVTDDTFICLAYPPASGARIKYVRFYVEDVSAIPAADYLNVAIFSQATVMGVAGAYTHVYDYSITNDVLIDNGYAGGYAADSVYIVELPEEVYLQPKTGVAYYLVFYPSLDLDLYYDAVGTTDGCAYATVGSVDLTGDATIPTADVTIDDYAIAIEIYAEPDTWVQIEEGGSVEDENVAWQDPLYCTTGLNVGVDDWTDHDHIYNPGDAVSTANGSYINIDLAGTDNPLPTGDPWDPLSVGGKSLFPDYTAFGVRALRYVTVDGTFGADDELTILIHDDDSATPPVVGWQPIGVFSGAGAFSETIELPQIVRWIQLLETGPTGGTIVTDFNVFQVDYHVEDGFFYTDMANTSHPNWVANYPGSDAIYKVTAGNLAGAESNPSKPFTNRTNLD